ncbi:hypothetical protein B0H19DRAFT_1233331 [Mycena capillaripes]|nr:hypothetical protein B0H19DRAFT_1233331 [Mycena capillaripes]
MEVTRQGKEHLSGIPQAITAHRLGEAYILLSGFDQDSLESTLALLSKLSRLECVQIREADAAIPEHLTQLPSLKTLFLHTIIPFESFPDHIAARFSSLEVLNFFLTEPNTSITLLDAIESKALVSLYLAVEVPNALTITRLYTTITSILPYLTLENLNISTSTESDSEIPEDEFDTYGVPGRTLRILFPLTHLTEVRLTLNYGFDLDDEVVSEMAQAWCRIEQLQLESSYFNVPSHVTLVGIYAIAAHRQNLQWLDIVFNASEVPQLDYHISPQTTLTGFEVSSSPISSPDPVAAALSAMFPNLHGVSMDGESNLEYYWSNWGPQALVRRWRRVKSILKGGSDEDEWSDHSDEEEYYESSEEEELSESSDGDEQPE